VTFISRQLLRFYCQLIIFLSAKPFPRSMPLLSQHTYLPSPRSACATGYTSVWPSLTKQRCLHTVGYTRTLQRTAAPVAMGGCSSRCHALGTPDRRLRKSDAERFCPRPPSGAIPSRGAPASPPNPTPVRSVSMTAFTGLDEAIMLLVDLAVARGVSSCVAGVEVEERLRQASVRARMVMVRSGRCSRSMCLDRSRPSSATSSASTQTGSNTLSASLCTFCPFCTE
jgi:hypothetical protein